MLKVPSNLWAWRELVGPMAFPLKKQPRQQKNGDGIKRKGEEGGGRGVNDCQNAAEVGRFAPPQLQPALLELE